MPLPKHLLSVALLAALGGCSLAPTYHTPVVPLPAHYHAGPWQPAQPADGQSGAWWTRYGDPQLDALQQRLAQANPDLAAAVAHAEAASAYAGGLHGALAPQLDAQGGAQRQRQSDDRPLRGSEQPSVYNANTLGLAASFDLDLWGRLRNRAAAGDAQAQASADDLGTATLALQGQLTALYLHLRGLDQQDAILQAACADFRQALALTQSRYEGQIASELDLVRARTQLAAAQAQADDVRAQRHLAEHAIAELVGAPASTFAITPRPPVLRLPAEPNSLPSALLQRRPDVAAAERRVYAANAAIGVARAAWYPDLDLAASLGGQTMGSGDLLAAGNRFWALGPLVNLPLFDGGQRRAAERQAQAEFDEAAAHYRATVLHAIREVEDQRAQLADLAREAADQQATVDAANQAQSQAQERYRDGTASYLDVVAAQTAALQAQRQLQAVQTRRLQASAALFVALGGDWAATGRN